MQKLILCALLACLVSTSEAAPRKYQSPDCLGCLTASEWAAQDAEDEDLKALDPMPEAHEGLGCMTDSECEGISEEIEDENE